MPLPKPTWHPWIPADHFAPGGLADGLMGAWFALEGAGTLVHDLSRQGNHGSLQGDVTWIAGRDGPKLTEFNDVGNGVDITGVESTVGTYTFVMVLDARTTSDTFDYAWDFDTGRLVIAYQAETAGKIGYYDGAWRNVADTPLDGEQHTLAWVLDGGAGVGSVYDNGTLLGTAAYSATNLGGSAAIGHNRNLDPLTGTLETDIHSAIIFDRALPAAEIRTLHGDPYALLRPLRRWWAVTLDVGITHPVIGSGIVNSQAIIGGA